MSYFKYVGIYLLIGWVYGLYILALSKWLNDRHKEQYKHIFFRILTLWPYFLYKELSLEYEWRRYGRIK